MKMPGPEHDARAEALLDRHPLHRSLRRADMAATTAYMVTAGDYEYYRVLAVFASRGDAERFKNRHNERDRYEREHVDPAHVEDIAFYRAGTWRPDVDEVIDGEVVTKELTR